MKFLLTGRLNQDSLENLFSVIRGKGEHRDNPDSVQFKAAFTETTIDSIFLTSVVELLIAICPQIHRSILFLPCRVISISISSEVL